MGLDMYLERRTYVKNWDFGEYSKPENRHEVSVLKGGVPVPQIKPERIKYVIEDIAYWRKANAIHNWFVQECQGGMDDCRDAYVDREQLQALVDLCRRVLAEVGTVPGDVNNGTTYHGDGSVEHHVRPGNLVKDKALAADLLPTQGGFFFGSTDYDENYLEDLQNTIDQIEPVLAEGGDGDFYYHSSW